jgi:hypothetical protein
MQPRMPLLPIVGLALATLLAIECCALAPIARLTPPTATPIVILVTATPTRTPLPPPPTRTPTPIPSDTPVPLPTHTPTLLPTGTPLPPTQAPSPTPTPYDFVVVQQRMWTNEENGGVSQDGTVIGCGYGHQIYVWVIDAAGNPLDGVVLGDAFNNPRHISGEKGPGHAVYDLHMNGYRLMVVEDTGAGHPVTSELSPVMSSNDWEIPIPWLIEAHYCATEEECLARRADPKRVGSNSLCWGHYSYEITFQRMW